MIIADEIHADIVYDTVHHSIGSFEKMMQYCVVLNAPSKTFNIAGLNTSYAVIPNATLRQSYIEEQNKSGITNGNPFGIEALMVAYEEGAFWLEELKHYLKDNIRYVDTFITKENLPIIPVKTEATFLMWLDCHALYEKHHDVKNFFIQEAKLGLNSGLDFGKSGDRFMRLNIAVSREILEEAMQRLLYAYRGRK